MFTVGHSTRSLDELISLLKVRGVTALADIRTIPRSRRYPHFAQDALSTGPAFGGYRVSSLSQPRRSAKATTRFDEHGLAARGLSWVCRLHADAGVRAGARGADREWGWARTNGDNVRRGGLVAVSPSARRGRAGGSRTGRASHHVHGRCATARADSVCASDQREGDVPGISLRIAAQTPVRVFRPLPVSHQ